MYGFIEYIRKVVRNIYREKQSLQMEDFLNRYVSGKIIVGVNLLMLAIAETVTLQDTLTICSITSVVVLMILGAGKLLLQMQISTIEKRTKALEFQHKKEQLEYEFFIRTEERKKKLEEVTRKKLKKKNIYG